MKNQGFPSDTQRSLVHNIRFNSAFVSFAGSMEALNALWNCKGFLEKSLRIIHDLKAQKVASHLFP